jgi:pyrimidine deaminase RibD-like protein
MSVLSELDRSLLRTLATKARGERRPPCRLGIRAEPFWGAMLCAGNKELASSFFQPGDSEDAIKKLFARVPEGTAEFFTLYLTLEPRAGFERLPPVTESVRRLGVKRVVLGALDPAHRFRGEGRAALEGHGIEVVLADGEEARECQSLVDDYEKSMTRGVAQLTARVKVAELQNGDYDLEISSEALPPGAFQADAVIRRTGRMADARGGWMVVLDADGWERPSDRTILYQPEDRAVAGARRLSFDDSGRPNLAALLRDLAGLGIYSAELSNDGELFRQALTAGLVDSVIADFPNAEDPAQAASRVARVRVAGGEDSLSLRLEGARFLDKDNRRLEARVELN